MSKRPYGDESDSGCRYAPPAQRVYWPPALLAARDDPCSLLNPRASAGALMCNDVLELVRRRVTAPRLHASVRRGGPVGRPETYTAAQAHVAAYDFDLGWSGDTVELQIALRGCKLYTVCDELCGCFNGNVSLEQRLEMRRLCDDKLIFTLPRWSDCNECWPTYAGLIPCDDEFLYRNSYCTKLVAVRPNAESVGAVVWLPQAMQCSRLVAFVDHKRLFFSSPLRSDDTTTQVSWGLYDLNTAQIAAHHNNFALPHCPPRAGEGSIFPLNHDSLIAAAYQYLHRIDLRCDHTQTLRPPPEEEVIFRFLDETVWLALSSNGAVVEYDARADRWQQPHTPLPLLSDHHIMDSAIAQ